jgi:hypothetical protein
MNGKVLIIPINQSWSLKKMDSQAIKELTEQWNLRGLGIGAAVGLVLEMSMIRNSKGRVNWIISILSIISVGVMGWITYDIAVDVFPTNLWKPAVWSFGISANTWMGAKAMLNGQATRILLELFLPESMKQLLKRRADDRQ